jgi:hypothetical protein
MLRDRYPYLYRLIGRIRGDLSSKLRLAQDYLVSERSQVAGQAIFFSSLRHFHRVATGQTEHPRYSNRQNEKVDRYCLLGLMRKLPDAEVPPGLLQDAIRRRLKQGHKYRIQFFTFPAYTTELLDRANYRACRLIEAGVSVRGISSELIAGLFGDDVVCDVYPQIGDVQPSVAQVEFGAAVEQSLLSAVESKDYATIRQIRADMRRYDQWASVTARRIEKCLPAILIRLKLTKRTCDRQMKKSLGIGGSGYPKVIVRLDATKRGKIDESCE